MPNELPTEFQNLYTKLQDINLENIINTEDPEEALKEAQKIYAIKKETETKIAELQVESSVLEERKKDLERTMKEQLNIETLEELDEKIAQTKNNIYQDYQELRESLASFASDEQTLS